MKKLLVELVDVEDIWNEATEEDIIKDADALMPDEYYVFIKATSREEANEVVEKIFEDKEDDDYRNLYLMDSELGKKVSYIYCGENNAYISDGLVREYKEHGYTFVYHNVPYEGGMLSSIDDVGTYTWNVLRWKNEDGSNGYGLINEIKEIEEEKEMEKRNYMIQVNLQIADEVGIGDEFKSEDEYEVINYCKVDEYREKCMTDLEKFCNENNIEFEYHNDACWEAVTSMDEYCEELSATLVTDIDYETLKEELSKLRKNIDYCKNIIIYDENEEWEEIR